MYVDIDECYLAIMFFKLNRIRVVSRVKLVPFMGRAFFMEFIVFKHLHKISNVQALLKTTQFFSRYIILLITGGKKMEKLSKKDLLLVSLMLFSMFFGAGNLIFPPILGQLSGTNLYLSLGGFLISAVGLPILAVATIAKSGGLQILAARVNKKFALVFTILIYLSIGPFLGIPRAGSLAFEMGVSPFLPKNIAKGFLPLFIYTLVYFSIAYWLSIRPSKLVDRFGKVLTPSILILIAVIFLKSIIKPIGGLSAPIGDYAKDPILKGFLEGYMTMDAIAALNFGVVITLALKQKGLTSEKALTKNTIKAGVIAGVILTLIYAILSYLGATAQTRFGAVENGAQSLTNIVLYLFGTKGTVILGLIFSLACLTTSVGLITSCSEYFSTLSTKINYEKWVTILCISSMIFANVGLTNILKISYPVLTIIYPMAIVLMVLGFMHKLFKGYGSVYLFSMIFTSIFSILDGLRQFGLSFKFMENMPLYSEGLVWILPAIIGGIIGFIYETIKEAYFPNSVLAKSNKI